MANRAVVGSVFGGLSRVGGPQARKDFIAEATKNHGAPPRKTKIALRAKRNVIGLGQDDVDVSRIWRRASCRSGSPWSFVVSVIKPRSFLVADECLAMCSGEPRA